MKLEKQLRVPKSLSQASSSTVDPIDSDGNLGNIYGHCHTLHLCM